MKRIVLRSVEIWFLAALVCIGISVASSLWTGSAHQSRAADVGKDAEWPRILIAWPITGLERPAHITHAGDRSDRLFVVEQTGRIRIIKDGALLDTPFLDIGERVSCCGERGLLGLAFPPSYADNGRFYVNYTDRAGNTVVARYRVSGNPEVADIDTEEIVLAVDQPYSNHNGGQLAFGPNDGFLYVGLGDGGNAGDPENRAQDPKTLLGKLLRIDVETGNPPTYTIPVDNPYTFAPGYRAEIWALGLRNPWRFSFDRETGDLYIGDVGQRRYEEIDYQPASSAGGENYGWRRMEGSHCFNPQDCDPAGLVLPVTEYEHTQGNCSVTGGQTYRGGAYPALAGIYFYADYCTGRIWGLKRLGTAWENRLLYDASFRISSFGFDEAGNLWVAKYDDGTKGAIYRVAEAASVSYLPLALR